MHDSDIHHLRRRFLTLSFIKFRDLCFNGDKRFVPPSESEVCRAAFPSILEKFSNSFAANFYDCLLTLVYGQTLSSPLTVKARAIPLVSEMEFDTIDSPENIVGHSVLSDAVESLHCFLAVCRRAAESCS